jgi:hypothetical protein
MYIPFGHDNIYPNQYILLVGDPGTRKGTAINPAKRLLKHSGYLRFAPDKLSTERFIIELELAGRINTELLESGIELENLTIDQPSELYICNGEFGDFIGDGNLSFIRLLTNLWDNLPEYKHPKIHGKSALVFQPTVNLLGGTTSQDIATSLPIEAIGQGFLSRFIFVQAEGIGRMYSRLPPIDEQIVIDFAHELKEIKTHMEGEIMVAQDVWDLLHRIYTEFVDLEDYRFKHYSTRRYTHLLKLAMIFAAMRKDRHLSKEDCINANTMLHYTEAKMHKALGEFGKAKNADIANNIMGMIRGAKEPITMREIWKRVSQDLNKMSDLTEILNNLKNAGKIQVVTTRDNRQGFLPLQVIKDSWKPELLNDEFLTAEERM